MPTYSYKATDRGGKIVKGTLEAAEESGVVARIHEMGYIPIRISPTGRDHRGLDRYLSGNILSIFTGISTKDVVIFTQDISSLLEAGLPVDRALSILIDVAEKESVKEVIKDILKTVQGGSYLSDALAKHPRVFSTLYVNMVRAGEAGGVLEAVLVRLGIFLETSQDLKDYIKSALVYPIFLGFVSGISIIILLTFVLPKFSIIFSDMGDDPDKGAAAVKSLFSSIHNGAYQAKDGNDQFFVLGLAPNSARIVVRYWKAGTIASFSENIAKWFNDLEIIGIDHYGYPPLKKLLRATALQYKDDNIPPNLPADVIRNILSGGRLPDTFMQSVIRRIKAEQGSVNFNRACILKAYLNRKYRLSTTNQRELTVPLNKKEKRIGYCLGRLFAILEKLQSEAQGTVNATIRDRYYNSASTTPRTVFGTLIRLSMHHFKKLNKPEKKKIQVHLEKRMNEVMELIVEFPSHLNLENQSLFAIGYYHQKQDFFTKNTDQGEEK